MLIELGRLGIASIMMAIILIGCATGLQDESSGGFCDIYEPIYTSEKDTEGTIKQAIRNNSVWLELCDEGAV